MDQPAVFRITGSGALTCLQGLFTNDLDHPGDGSLTYGAMLTPKGMIVVDAWVIRQAGALTLIAPASGTGGGARDLPAAPCRRGWPRRRT